MKTNIYIDGYNLYYGCLKHSHDKWLDPQRLFFDLILRAQAPSSELVSIKFFTADIKAKIASNGQLAQQAQQTYHRALEQIYPDSIKIIKGYYSLEKARLPVYQKPPNKTDRVDIWKLEEKQTDVNIALEAYRAHARRWKVTSEHKHLRPPSCRCSCLWIPAARGSRHGLIAVVCRHCVPDTRHGRRVTRVAAPFNDPHVAKKIWNGRKRQTSRRPSGKPTCPVGSAPRPLTPAALDAYRFRPRNSQSVGSASRRWTTIRARDNLIWLLAHKGQSVWTAVGNI